MPAAHERRAARRLRHLSTTLCPLDRRGAAGCWHCAAAATAHPEAAAAASSATGGSGPALEVRPARPEELPRAVEIVNEAFAAAYAHVRTYETYESRTTAEPRTTIERLRASLESGGADCVELVCVEAASGVIVGAIMAAISSNDFATMSRPDTHSFGSLAVALSAQRRGIGERLVAAAEQHARACGKT